MRGRLSLALLLGLLVLVGLFMLLKPEPPAPAAVPAAAPAVAAPQAPLPPAAPRRYEWQLQDGHLSAGPALLAVTQGEQVQLSVTADRAGELHLHGYDLQANLQPGVAVVLDFVADRSGRFELELHGAHHEALGALEVQPRP